MAAFWEELENAAVALPWWAVVAFCGGVIIACFWVGYSLRRRGVLWGGYLFSAGVSFAAKVLQGWEGRQLAVLLAAFACAACLSQLAFSLALFVRNKRRLRRWKQLHVHRNCQFTLPDKDNKYLRQRLQTALSCEKSEEPRQVGVCGDYARERVMKLKGAGLSTVDELRLNDLAKGLEMLLMKEKLTATEQADLNVSLSALLKMSAKYGV